MGDMRTRTRAREPLHYNPESVKFDLYSKEEILLLSVVEINNLTSFNNLGHPCERGLYDLKMGPYCSKGFTVCATCHEHLGGCSGHIGHIKLPMPVINPLFYNDIYKVLQVSCFKCHRFMFDDINVSIFQAQMQFLSRGLIAQAEEVEEFFISREKKKSEDRDKLKEDIQNYIDDQLKANENLVKPRVEESSNRMVDSLCRGYVKAMWANAGKIKGICPHCLNQRGFLAKTKNAFLYCDDKQSDDSELKKYPLNASDIMNHMRKLYELDTSLLCNLVPVLKSKATTTPTDLLFVQVLPVPPPRSRPAQFAGGVLSIHPQSSALVSVIETVLVMEQVLPVVKQVTPLQDLSKDAQDMIKNIQGENINEKLGTLWKELQSNVDGILDKNMTLTKSVSGWGLKQLIEHKEGLFRMNMMGKRVNHACRTVITPDPNVNIDEIGVPEVFAKKLTYPVPVTPYNVKELRELILNGPNKHPGANMVEDEFGKVTFLSQDYNQRFMMANTLLTPSYRNKFTQRLKIVHRHLKNGDAMLLNRQPTLHRPSIMAHKARVLRGEKVMRLHYSNCKSYNADFDGDEMNAHFPQSEIGRSEAYNICMSAHQYLGPKDGAPLQGLIQDHVIAGVKMTLRGRFFTRSEYMQFVYQALQKSSGKIKTLPPTILKPKVLWSGKQVLSTILLNVIPAGKPAPNFSSQAKIRVKLWQNAPSRPWKGGGTPERDDVSMSESDVIIRGGILCSGVLDKAQYGATPYSVAHLLFELYGERSCCSFLSGISQLFTFFLQSVEGFSLGVEDILVRDKPNKRRKEVMKVTATVGDKCAAKGVGAKEEVTEQELHAMMEESHRASAQDPRLRGELDAGYKELLNPATNDINAICVPAGLIKPFPHNNLQLMVNSGAKGSTVNTTQISCLLGQIELEGKRPPIMISGKSLPSFPAYCTHPRAGGYIDGRFMTGIKPQEFYFHCMAGREGLIDTAVKTSRSGYLQRCLIKLLEGLVVQHDFTVRDSDNTVVQFQYGEDSLDICKAQYIKPSKLKDIANNLEAAVDNKNVEIAKSFSDLKAIKSRKKELKKWSKQQEGLDKSRQSPFLKLSSSLSSKYPGYKKMKLFAQSTEVDSDLHLSRPESYQHAAEAFSNMDQDDKTSLMAEYGSIPDPVASKYLPPLHFTSLTEVCDDMINKYVKDNKTSMDVDRFKDAMYLKVQQSHVCPGEPVGVLAAQSVGEPSTQMTLNTFHFAGRGEMNVTLGIPRLREILMVASANIKTPSLSVPFLPTVTDKEKDKIRRKYNRVLVSDILEEVQVTERIVLNPRRSREIVLRYKFLPYKYYKKFFTVTPSMILKYIEEDFFSKVFVRFLDASGAKMKVKDIGTLKDDDNVTTAEPDTGKDQNKQAEKMADLAMGDVESDDDQENVEGEGTDVARKVSRQTDLEYEKMEEEDEAIKDNARDSSDDESDDNDTKMERNDEDEALGGMDFDEDDQESKVIKDTLLNDELMSTGAPAKRRKDFLFPLDKERRGKNKVGVFTDYQFDVENEEWFEVTISLPLYEKKPDMVNIIKKSAAVGVIYQVKNIKKAFIVEKDGKKYLQTDGINIPSMYKYDTKLDINNLLVNNIHDMARYYGIESAYKTIINEVKNVFGVYGIDVDYRHLSLIADYMTVDGTYRPFNRVGMENNPSPLQQMTFETAIKFLKCATLGGKSDHLQSPSASIVVGKHAKLGTGSVHLQYKI